MTPSPTRDPDAATSRPEWGGYVVGPHDCLRCEGEGMIYEQGYSVNPYSGIPVPDPQCERQGRCPDCGGTGLAP